MQTGFLAMFWHLYFSFGPGILGKTVFDYYNLAMFQFSLTLGEE